jgi:hypothetical protein
MARGYLRQGFDGRLVRPVVIERALDRCARHPTPLRTPLLGIAKAQCADDQV